jgi:hypothetical protein
MFSRWDFQDVALRALVLIGGAVAAALFVRQGQTQALAALAAGSTVGAVCMGCFGAGEE